MAAMQCDATVLTKCPKRIQTRLKGARTAGAATAIIRKTTAAAKAHQRTE
jgi:hypothetical protein